jgi:hypothetical protein
VGVRREACRHESRAGSDVDDGLLAGQLRAGCECSITRSS